MKKSNKDDFYFYEKFTRVKNKAPRLVGWPYIWRVIKAWIIHYEIDSGRLFKKLFFFNFIQ